MGSDTYTVVRQPQDAVTVEAIPASPPPLPQDPPEFPVGEVNPALRRWVIPVIAVAAACLLIASCVIVTVGSIAYYLLSKPQAPEVALEVASEVASEAEIVDELKRGRSFLKRSVQPESELEKRVSSIERLLAQHSAAGSNDIERLSDLKILLEQLTSLRELRNGGQRDEEEFARISSDLQLTSAEMSRLSQLSAGGRYFGTISTVTHSKAPTKYTIALGEDVSVYKYPYPCAATQLSPNGQLLAHGGQDGSVSLWDTATHRLLHRFQVAKVDYRRSLGYVGMNATAGEFVWSLAFSTDSKRLIYPSFDSRVDPSITSSKKEGIKLLECLLEVVDCKTGNKIRTIKCGDGNDAPSINTTTGNRVSTSSTTWDLQTGRQIESPLRRAGYKFEPSGLIITPDNKYMIQLSPTNALYGWQDIFSHVAICQKLPASSSRDGVVWSYDAQTDFKVPTTKLGVGFVSRTDTVSPQSMCISPSSEEVSICFEKEMFARIIEISTGRIRDLPIKLDHDTNVPRQSDKDSFLKCQLTPDGKFAVACFASGSLGNWMVLLRRTDGLVVDAIDFKEQVWNVEVAPDGTTAIAVTSNQSGPTQLHFIRLSNENSDFARSAEGLLRFGRQVTNTEFPAAWKASNEINARLKEFAVNTWQQASNIKIDGDIVACFDCGGDGHPDIGDAILGDGRCAECNGSGKLKRVVIRSPGKPVSVSFEPHP